MADGFSKFKPKKFQERDIDIEIECCGVCGSDVHTINGGWGGAPMPLCVGHEVIGKAVKIGDGVKTVKVGDRVGVGAQIWACLECKPCKTDNENYCPNKIGEYDEQCSVSNDLPPHRYLWRSVSRGNGWRDRAGWLRQSYQGP